MSKINIAEVKKYVASEFKINITKLSDEDLIKLAKYSLIATEYETPMIAKANRQLMGL